MQARSTQGTRGAPHGSGATTQGTRGAPHGSRGTTQDTRGAPHGSRGTPQGTRGTVVATGAGHAATASGVVGSGWGRGGSEGLRVGRTSDRTPHEPYPHPLRSPANRFGRGGLSVRSDPISGIVPAGCRFPCGRDGYRGALLIRQCLVIALCVCVGPCYPSHPEGSCYPSDP